MKLLKNGGHLEFMTSWVTWSHLHKIMIIHYLIESTQLKELNGV